MILKRYIRNIIKEDIVNDDWKEWSRNDFGIAKFWKILKYLDSF